MFLVDSHCHLHMLDLSQDHDDLSQVIKRAYEQGVKYLLNVSVNLQDFPRVLKIAETYDGVGVSVGLHPNERAEEVDEATLVKLGQAKKVIAIGETGLDYFRSEGDLTWQRERFRAHIRAAKTLQKPLIVHTRDAIEDTLNLMQKEKVSEIGGVMHCFTEDWPSAERALAMGFYISFSGIVTFKNAEKIQATARQVPLERMLLETDSPYLAPNPKRGKPNEPAYTRYTAEYLAALRGISLETLAAQTTENFFTLFKGAQRPHV